MSLNYTIIGRKIQEIRKKRKITQEKFSEIIDKSPSYISYIETGRKQLSLETLVDIANALKVTADVLLSFNLVCEHGSQEQLSGILDDCSSYEKKVITDTAIALKKTLRDNCMPQDFD